MLQPFLTHFQLGYAANVQAVKLGSKLQNSLVAAGFHLVQNMTHRLVHLMIHAVIPGQQGRQRAVKACIGGVQSLDVNGHVLNPVVNKTESERVRAIENKQRAPKRVCHHLRYSKASEGRLFKTVRSHGWRSPSVTWMCLSVF